MNTQPILYSPASATDVAKTFERHGFVPPSTTGYHKAIREQLDYIPPFKFCNPENKTSEGQTQ